MKSVTEFYFCNCMPLKRKCIPSLLLIVFCLIVLSNLLLKLILPFFISFWNNSSLKYPNSLYICQFHILVVFLCHVKVWFYVHLYIEVSSPWWLSLDPFESLSFTDCFFFCLSSTQGLSEPNDLQSQSEGSFILLSSLIQALISFRNTLTDTLK